MHSTRREIDNAQAAPRPVVRVKPYDYQPSKAELEKLVRINASPNELCRSAMTSVRIIEDPDA